MPKAPEHPNLLFIMTDDMGAWAMHCAGNSEIHTPNLDRLAAMGMRMENLFCVSPVCSPARPPRFLSRPSSVANSSRSSTETDAAGSQPCWMRPKPGRSHELGNRCP